MLVQDKPNWLQWITALCSLPYKLSLMMNGTVAALCHTVSAWFCTFAGRSKQIGDCLKLHKSLLISF